MAPSPLANETESRGFKISHDRIELRTDEPLQFVDITEQLSERVQRSGVDDGMVTLQTRHTTTAILVNENEPLLLRDLEELLERWAPLDRRYRHDDLEARRGPLPPNESRNGHAHARAVMLGTSESLSIVDGAVQLGTWQRVFLVELDGPRKRSVSLVFIGVGGGAAPRREPSRPIDHRELRGVS